MVDIRSRVAVTGSKSPRGIVRKISGKSRMRLIRTLAQVSRMDEPLFVTLTYRDFVPDFAVWKSDLNRFRTNIREFLQDSCGLWRLEFQERGAPHFHILLWGIVADDLERVAARMSKAWCSATGDESPAHYTHGCDVVRVTNFRACAFYISLYQSKDSQDSGGIPTGRCWGLWGRDRLGLQPIQSFGFLRGDFILYRRALRALYRAHTRKSGKRKNSRYERALRFDQGLTTFLPVGEATRLAAWVMREGNDRMSQDTQFLAPRENAPEWGCPAHL